jgi:hypothetical protein
VVEPTVHISSSLRKQVEQGSLSLVRAIVQEFAEAFDRAGLNARCGGPYRSAPRLGVSTASCSQSVRQVLRQIGHTALYHANNDGMRNHSPAPRTLAHQVGR